MAYFLIFAFFPLLMVIHASFSMAITGFDIEDTFFYSLLPDVIGDLVDTYLEHIGENSNISFLFIGIVLTVYTLTRFMKSMKKSVRKLYDSSEFKNPFTEAAISVMFSILIIAAFFVSLVLLILGGQIVEYIESHFTFLDLIKIKTVSRFVFTSGIIFAVILLLYYWIPNVSHKAKDFMPGTIFTTGAWIVVSGIFSFYMDNFSNYSLIYGSIGAFIILLIWIYMSCLILLIGASINAVIYKKGTSKKLRINER